MFLKEPFYCSLLLRKAGVSVPGQTVHMNILRNSDQKFLAYSTSSWALVPEDILVPESSSPGFYMKSIDFNAFNPAPDQYTIIYKYLYNGTIISESEQVLYERKNRSKLV